LSAPGTVVPLVMGLPPMSVGDVKVLSAQIIFSNQCIIYHPGHVVDQ